MAIKDIKLGTEPDGVGGDTLRSSATKTNENFVYLDNLVAAANKDINTANLNILDNQTRVTALESKTDNTNTELQYNIASLLKYTKGLEDKLYQLAPYTPYHLFRDNKKIGVWFDPSDLKTLYQDSRGIKPVTKNGDPVGLILDKSQGLELGEELYKGFRSFVGTNFSQDSEGVLHLNGKQTSDEYAVDLLDADKMNGKSVKVTLNMRYVEGSSKQTMGYLFEGSSTISGIPEGETHIYTTATNLKNYFRIRSRSNDAFYLTISIKEIKGKHARQTLAAARPTYRTDGILHWLEFDGVDDALATGGNFTINKGFYVCSGLSVTKYEDTAGTGAVFGAVSGINYQRISLRGDASARQISVSNRTSGDAKSIAIRYAYELDEKMVISGGHNTDNLLYMEKNLKDKQAELNIELTEYKNAPITIGNNFGINFYGGVWIDSSLELSKDIEKYFANRTGVTI